MRDTTIFNGNGGTRAKRPIVAPSVLVVCPWPLGTFAQGPKGLQVTPEEFEAKLGYRRDCAKRLPLWFRSLDLRVVVAL